MRTRATRIKFRRYNIPGSMLRDFRSPAVYAWSRDGRVLYVGSSVNGFGRPAELNHERLRDVRPTDELAMFCVDGHIDEPTLRGFEHSVIAKLVPVLQAGRAMKVAFARASVDPDAAESALIAARVMPVPVPTRGAVQMTFEWEDGPSRPTT
jgi:hypothetical protein